MPIKWAWQRRVPFARITAANIPLCTYLGRLAVTKQTRQRRKTSSESSEAPCTPRGTIKSEINYHSWAQLFLHITNKVTGCYREANGSVRWADMKKNGRRLRKRQSPDPSPSRLWVRTRTSVILFSFFVVRCGVNFPLCASVSALNTDAPYKPNLYPF